MPGSAARSARPAMETLFVSLLALAALGYLVAAVLRPEKF
ncbi:MAG TPA: potassium-transporting ATPase subunit F [Candidatus Didemnitutus sp.]|nr:potassium-transporting ATPase subunit F [Candidatus Didemnitutus sp.]